MPELPEVETVRRGLLDWLPGRQILRAERADAPPGPKYRHLEEAAGQRILEVQRRGKYILLPLSGGDTLVIHLGMTGVIRKTACDTHLRVVLTLDGPDPDHLYFQDIRRFGRFLLARGGDFSSIPTLHALGPEPLAPDFTAEALRGGLQSRAALKTILLNQRAVAGLGNIYVDEALWRSEIHPLLPAKRVTKAQARRLRDHIVAILSAAIDSGGTTLSDYRKVDGGRGGYQDVLNAYGQTGKPCARCETLIERIVIAQRSTHFCPKCQRAPRAKRRR